MTEVSPYIFAGLPQDKINTSRIIKAVCQHFNIEEMQLMTKNRNRKFSYAKQMVQYLVRRRIGLTLMETAKIFNVQYTAVCHSEKFIDEQLSIPKTNNTQQDLDSILAILKPLTQTIK